MNDAKLAEAEAVFRNSWNIYQKVLEGNYLCHSQLYKPLTDALSKHDRIRVLDLGCGDSDYFCKAVTASQNASALQYYVGVDMSKQALHIGQENLKACLPRAAQISSVLSDMVDYVEKADEKFDIILVSFALHHLTLPQKIQVISGIRKLLTDDGEAYIIDIFRREGETLEGYRERALADLTTWELVGEEGRATLHDHMATYDFPEPFSTFHDVGLDKGFSKVSCMYTTDNEISKCVVLRA